MASWFKACLAWVDFYLQNTLTETVTTQNVKVKRQVGVGEKNGWNQKVQ